ncbi:MAG TPA: Hsp20/alpha crystallin family protein [Bacillota bacterium]|nr:Hsp20/alpha crystallin family protein [Bacillota bacterium]
MTFNQKDLLKLAFELYEKTRETGLLDAWSRNSLESFLEFIKNTGFEGLISRQTGKSQEEQQKKEANGTGTGRDGSFWNQETGFTHPDKPEPGALNENAPPISIFETAGHVNVHVILPYAASLNDIALSVSEETIELDLSGQPGKSSGNVDHKENIKRTIHLPAAVDPSRTVATCRNRFLTISAPKKTRPSSKKVQIKFER